MAASSYQAALDRLSRIPAGMNYGDELARVAFLRQLLNDLGFDQLTSRIIRVAGTNGKGSTSAMLSSVLQAAGNSVGVFSSPYLFEVREEIQINNQSIAPDDFASALAQVEQILAQRDLTLVQDVSEFEAVFLLAMAYFIRRNPDYLILEIGLGGELDATNAVPRSDYAIFTRIGMDHMKFLGDNLKAIATSKVGMVRTGETIITAASQRPETMQVLEKIAQDRHNRLVSASRVRLDRVQQSASGALVDLTVGKNSINDILLPLQGSYQLDNLKTAVAAWSVLAEDGRRGQGAFAGQPANTTRLPGINDLKIGISNTKMPGRFETLRTRPNRWIVDGAHNADGIEALIDTVNRDFADQPKVLIVGFLADKEVAKLVGDLAQLTNTTFVVTTPDNQARQLAANQLYQQFKAAMPDLPDSQLIDCPQPREAVAYVNQHFRAADQVVIATGSFYLIKEIMKAVADLDETKLSSD